MTDVPTEAADVVEAFELNYNVGSAVMELLQPDDDGSLCKALRHLLREAVRVRALPSHDLASALYTQNQEGELRKLARDLVESIDCEEQRSMESEEVTREHVVDDVTRVLKGLVLRTHRQSREDLESSS